MTRDRIKYLIEQFTRKFSAIPEDRWTTGEVQNKKGKRCVFGHCLSAVGTTDPDGHGLRYEWFYYPEAGTLAMSNARSGQPLTIEDADKAEAWFAAPIAPANRVLRNGTMHIILAVTDRGVPSLTRYARVIVTVAP